MSGEMILLGLAGVIEAGAPIVLAAIGETLTERAGVINLSLNGLIILSAMMGFWVALETNSILLGFLTGMLVGVVVSALIAFSSITLKQSQVAVGFILAVTCEDLAYFLGNPIMGAQAPIMYATPIPLLKDIPILGPLFFQHSVITYLSIVLIIAAWFWISKTRPGLILRGIGEKPAGLVVFNQLAEAEEGCALADTGGLLHIVGNNDDRVPVLELGNQLLDAGRGDRIERRAGFVHEQGPGPRRQGAGNAEALLLPPRQGQSRFLKVVLDFIP